MPPVPGPGHPFDVPGNYVENRRGRLCLLRFFLLVLLAGVIELSPLVHASPPDPVWIPGFNDDVDHDDVVVFLTNMRAVTDRPLDVGRGSTFAFTLSVRP